MAASSSIVFMCFCSSRMDNRGTSVSFENDFYLNFSFVELFTKDCYQNFVVYRFLQHTFPKYCRYLY